MAEVTAAGTRPATYTVKRGDTLTKLGERFDMAWKDIYRANRDTISDPDLIRVGQKLKIPGGTGDAGTNDAARGAKETEGKRASATAPAADEKKKPADSKKSDKPQSGSAVGSGATGTPVANQAALPNASQDISPIAALMDAARIPGIVTMQVTMELDGRMVVADVPADMTSARIIAMEESRHQTRRAMQEREARINHFVNQINDFSLPMAQRESAHHIVQAARAEMLQLYNSWLQDSSGIATALRDLSKSLQAQIDANKKNEQPAGAAAAATGGAARD